LVLGVQAAATNVIHGDVSLLFDALRLEVEADAGWTQDACDHPRDERCGNSEEDDSESHLERTLEVSVGPRDPSARGVDDHCSVVSHLDVALLEHVLQALEVSDLIQSELGDSALRFDDPFSHYFASCDLVDYTLHGSSKLYAV
jgi:hypothetical protein